MGDLLSFSHLLFAIVVCLLGLACIRLRQTSQLQDVPWINHNSAEWFGKLRARIRTTLNYKAAIHTAYEEYSKRSLSCILPSISDVIIVLPADSVNWIINQPDSVLSSFDVLKNQLQVDHTFPLPSIVHNPTHHDTIKSELTRQVANLTNEIMDELAASFNDLWGTDTVNWKEICVFETVMRIVARTSNRVFVGLPLCRNEKYLDSAAGFAQDVPFTSAILKQLPSPLRILLGRLITRPNRRHFRDFANLLKPEIQRREGLAEKTRPNDLLQWTLDRASASRVVGESNPDVVSARVIAINLAAIHTSTFSATNAIFDLVSSPPSNLSILRAEAESVLASNGGSWSKQAINSMTKHDSCLRESARLGSFTTIGLTRQVMVPSGITAPNGTHLPYGAWVGVPSFAVHNDPAIYEDVTEFKPFRFSNVREAENSHEQDDQSRDKDAYLKKANLSFVSMSPTYHPFGHGRHACPGRFFAANELKLLLAYMVLNYEFDMQASRPENKWMGPIILPPLKDTVRVRRRKN